MITLKSPREIDAMARAGAIVAGTLARMRDLVRPGVTTLELDEEAEAFIRSHAGARPSFKGLYGFPRTLCISVDEEIVHGIPSRKRVLEEGSIVSVDCGVHLEGLHADSATTIPVGQVSATAERLMRVTQEALAAGVAAARVGNHVGAGRAGRDAGVVAQVLAREQRELEAGLQVDEHDGAARARERDLRAVR